MAFITWNNGTLGRLPNVQGITRTQVALPVVLTVYGPLFSKTHSNPWWVNYINAIRATWLNNLFLYRIFPQTSLGDLLRSDPSLVVVSYGNVLDDVLDPLTLLSTFQATATFSSPGPGLGNSEGLDRTEPNNDPPIAPPNPPLPSSLAPTVASSGTVEAGGELPFDVAIDGQDAHSSLLFSYCYAWTVASPNQRPTTWEPGTLCYQIVGSRAVLMSFFPDWKERPPSCRWSYPDDVFESDAFIEQRVSTLPAPVLANAAESECVHFLQTRFKTDGREDSINLWTRLIRMRHNRVALPFWFEPLVTAIDSSGLSTITIVSLPLDSLMYESGEIVRFDRRDRYYETRAVTGINRPANTIDTAAPWERAIPPQHAVIYMVLYGAIDSPPKRTLDTDTHQTIDVDWRSIR